MNTVDLIHNVNSGPISGSAVTNPEAQAFGQWIAAQQFGGTGNPGQGPVDKATGKNIEPETAIQEVLLASENAGQAIAVLCRMPLAFTVTEGGSIQFEVRENAKLTDKHLAYALHKNLPHQKTAVTAEVKTAIEAAFEEEKEPEEMPDNNVEDLESEYIDELDQLGEEE